MKKILLMAALAVSISSCRVADFTIVSTRNVDVEAEHKLVKANVKASAFNIESAIDKCLKETGGEYLSNVVIKTGLFLYYVSGDAYSKK